MRGAGRDAAWAEAALAVLTNAALDAAARPLLQAPAVLVALDAFTRSATPQVCRPLLFIFCRTARFLPLPPQGARDAQTVARAVTLLSRVCVTPAACDALAATTLPRLVQALVAGAEDNAAPLLWGPLARLFVLVQQHSAAGRAVIGQKDAVLAAATAWLRPAPAAGLPSTAAGNAALWLAEQARAADVCAWLAPTDVVAWLLALAKRDKSQEQENAAIALARLAQGHPVRAGLVLASSSRQRPSFLAPAQKHLEQLRAQRGLEILHARNAPKA